jgi:regulator of sirC expression with transglutaminase-like and TPR domain
MVEELQGDAEITSGSTERAALRLITYLFQECGFHGSRSDSMDDFANSYLNEVLDDREGIPLTLSIVYLEVARKLGLKDIYGVGLPARFMVAYDAEDNGAKKRKFIDVFEGGKVLSEEEVIRFVQESTGFDVTPEELEPATPRAIILRLLHNLVSYSKKLEQSLPYHDLIVNLEPESSQERLQRALTRMKCGDVAGTKEDLETLMEQKPDDLDMDKVQLLYRSL